MPWLDIPVLGKEFQHAWRGGHYSISLAVAVVGSQKLSSSTDRVFQSWWWTLFSSLMLTDDVAMFCVDCSYSFLSRLFWNWDLIICSELTLIVF
jgi:hypothetical protein